MSFSTFLLATFITLVTLFIIVKCWKLILFIGVFLYIVGQLIFWSLISTIIWVVFISNNTDGWGWTWFYFFILYSGIIITYALIVSEIFGMVVEWVGKMLKR